MSGWQGKLDAWNETKTSFYARAKCLDKRLLPNNHQETLNALILEFNSLSRKAGRIFDNPIRPSTEQANLIKADFEKARDKVIKVFVRHNWKYKIPSLGQQIDIQILEEEDDEEEEEEDDNDEMAAAAATLASSIIAKYNGEVEGFRAFMDSLTLAETLVGEHENVFVAVIKGKLTGTARDCVGNDVNTIAAIRAALTGAIKAPTTAVLEAKLASVTPMRKEREAFCKEIEEIAKSLKSAYISEGMPFVLAEQHAAREVKKSLTANTTDRELISSLRDRKLETVTEVLTAYGEVKQTHHQMNMIRRSNQPKYHNNRGRGHYRGRGRGNHYNRGSNNNSQNGNNYQNYNNNGNNGGNNRGNHHNNNNRGNRGNGHARAMQGNSQGASQGAQEHTNMS